jgi:DNA-binding transcriptional ArsR family regulator
MEKAEAQLDLVFSALSDRTRRKILEQVKLKDCTVMELSGMFDMSLPAVSKHLKVLDKSGLLQRQKDGRFVVCRFEPEPMREAIAWISRQHQFWNEGLDALEALLEDSTEKGTEI